MFIYNGKFDWDTVPAANETITFVFPAGFSLNDPVSAYWQWSKDFDFLKEKSSAANVCVPPECYPSVCR